MKLVFLDRDGVINRFPGKGLYVTHRRDFSFLPGALEALKELWEAGCRVVVVSNQGCVSRGLITREELTQMTLQMTSEVQKHGGKIDRVMYCLHQQSDRCDCKKPQTKLFLEALSETPVEMNQVYFVGDSAEDIQAANALGCVGILALSGRTQKEDLADFPAKPDVIKSDLKEAVEWILQRK